MKFKQLITSICLMGVFGMIGFAQTNPNTINTLDRRLLQYVSVVVTNTQMLAIHNTPITIVSAKGANTIIEPLGGILSFNGVGSYTINGSNQLKLWYTNRATGPAATAAITTVGFLDQSVAKIINFGGVPANELLSTNVPIVLQDTTGNAYTGGNATDTVTVRLAYRVHNK